MAYFSDTGTTQDSWRDVLDIDGSLLEGGGQVLRIAIALSAIKRVPVRIFNIRAGRSKPGLAEQHLKGLLLVRDMCNGKLTGAEIGSTEIFFRPGTIKGGHYESRVKTAGSVALLMQVSVPVALFAPESTSISMWGGTDADMAPPIDYMTQVTATLFSKFGAKFSTNVVKRGFFPRGGGEVHVQVESVCEQGLTPITWTDAGKISSIRGNAVVGGSCPIRVALEMKKGAENALLENFGSLTQPNISVAQGPADCAGSSITITANTSSGCLFGISAIGNRSKSPYDIGCKAARELVEAKPGVLCVDPHAQDQIILPMALSKGKSSVLCGPLTLHTQTAIAIVEKLCKAKFEISEQTSTTFIISCVGDPP